jgi:hypothetical protein
MTDQLGPSSTSSLDHLRQVKKKCARWVPKLFLQDQMDKRDDTLVALVKLVQEKGTGVLSKIITTEESTVSLHTPDKTSVYAVA